MLKKTIKPYLKDLQARLVTNREVAAILGVSEEHLCRTLKLLNVKKDEVKGKKYRAQLLAARKTFRETAANTLSIAEAAKLAKCSERTIYRYKNVK